MGLQLTAVDRTKPRSRSPVTDRSEAGSRHGKTRRSAATGYAGPTARAPGAVWLACHSRTEDIVLTGESVPSVFNAVKAGLGLSALPCFAAHDDASLVRLTPSLIARSEAFLGIPPDHRETVRVRLVMDTVTALCERQRKLLEGSA
jgi:DNA-binding transcriptional LysR family regulator